jgi:hypothetical protein
MVNPDGIADDFWRETMTGESLIGYAENPQENDGSRYYSH